MASEEILEVTRIGRADGQWGCKCPHCGRAMFFSEDTIEEVRGSQYQHTARLSFISEQRCNGRLEVSTTAKYSRIMFDQGGRVMLSVERMDEIARLVIHLNHIKGFAAVTSSGETVMDHTLVEQITTALQDLTAQLQAVSLNSTGQINELEAFNAMLASDYSSDKSGAVTEADEKAFIAGLWRVWQARAELARPAIPLFAVPEGFMLAPTRWGLP